MLVGVKKEVEMCWLLMDGNFLSLLIYVYMRFGGVLSSRARAGSQRISP